MVPSRLRPPGVAAVVRSLLGALLCLLASGCGAKLDYRGHVAADGRAFFRSPKYDEQRSGNGVSLVVEPEFYLQSASEKHLLTLRPFLRMDPHDERRTHWDIRRADYVVSLGDWELGAGAGIFSWRVLDSHGLTDIINQSDTVEAFDRSKKLGQPYVKIAWLPGDWAFRLYAFPYFREETFPGPEGRLRFASVVDTDSPLYEPRWRRWHPSFAGRVSVTAGDFDIGLGLFSGTSREPRFIAQLTEDKIIPAYDLAHQASLDLQWTVGALAIKLEGLGRLWSDELRFFFAVGAGLEYTFFDIAGSGVDLSFAGEYLFDSRPDAAPVTFFANDVFAGLRLAFNDVSGTTIRGGAVTDLGDLRSYLRIEAHRRLGNHWKVYLEVNGFVGREGELESGVLRDHYGQLRLAYYF